MCIVYERFSIVAVILVLKFDVLTLSSNITGLKGESVENFSRF